MVVTHGAVMAKQSAEAYGAQGTEDGTKAGTNGLSSKTQPGVIGTDGINACLFLLTNLSKVEGKVIAVSRCCNPTVGFDISVALV